MKPTKSAKAISKVGIFLLLVLVAFVVVVSMYGSKLYEPLDHIIEEEFDKHKDLIEDVGER